MAGATATGELRLAAGEVRLAVPDDDTELRALVRRSVMDGAVQVAMTREPAFFAADGLAGASDTTVVARMGTRIVGLGRVSVLSLMKNGSSNRIGYLAALRVDGGTARAPRLIREGYELLFSEVDPSATSFFTSIASDNTRARRVLEHGGRFGIPEYTPLANLVTLVAPVRRGATSFVTDSAPGAELTAFLQSQSAGYQFGLSWGDDLWRALGNHGVELRDFVVVRRDGRIVACAAVWDQSPFKQVVIHGYRGALSRLRPVANAARAWSGQPPLPPPGSVLRQGALLGAYAEAPGDWHQLWSALLGRARSMGLSWLTICRDERDPELAVLRRLTSARDYLTTLYNVGPPGEPWDERLFRPEAGLL